MKLQTNGTKNAKEYKKCAKFKKKLQILNKSVKNA